MYFTYPDFITSKDECGKNQRVKRSWSLIFHDKIVIVATSNQNQIKSISKITWRTSDMENSTMDCII